MPEHTSKSCRTYVYQDDLLALREPTFSDDRGLGLNRADGKPAVGEDGNDTSQEALRTLVVIRITGLGFSKIAERTSMINNQNHPVFPATPRMGRMAAASKLDKIRARFKLDLIVVKSALCWRVVQRCNPPEQRQSDGQLASLVEERSVKNGTGNESTAKHRRICALAIRSD
jgi:hypothetical protein